jgi:hypothetical protein
VILGSPLGSGDALKPFGGLTRFAPFIPVRDQDIEDLGFTGFSAASEMACKGFDAPM